MRPFEGTPFEGDVKPGLVAIERREYRSRISIEEEAAMDRAVSSVDIDASMSADFPRTPRWDYGIWLDGKKPKTAYVEAHKAVSGEVELVLRKQQWLKDLLIGTNLPQPCWFWLATGKNKIPPQSAHMRRLSLAGIRLEAGSLGLLRNGR